MSFVGDWVRQIAALIIVATVSHLLLPRNSMRSAVRFATGLILMLAVMEPIAYYLRGELPDMNLTVSSPHLDVSLYIEDGIRFSHEVTAQIVQDEKERIEKVLNAMIDMMDNVEGRVLWIPTDDMSQSIIEVTLRPPESEVIGLPSDPIGRREVERQVEQLLHAFVPDVSQIVFEWTDTIHR